MHRLSLLSLVFLASCIAHEVAYDAGSSEAGSSPNAQCAALGGTCIGAGPACLELISMAVSCGGTGAICCVVSATTTSASTATGAGDAATKQAATLDAALDVTTNSTTVTSSTCSLSCESTCEGDPVCIQSCGC
jgi:hypothetical protein